MEILLKKTTPFQGDWSGIFAFPDIRTTRFWNNLHQVRLKSKDWKVEFKSVLEK